MTEGLGGGAAERGRADRGRFRPTTTAIGAAVTGLLVASAAARAQVPPYAGLVVQAGDGAVQAFCLPLEGERTTGEQLLRRSGLPLAADATPLGTLICRIGDVGCDWPAESCWCRCRLLTGDCRYWAYSTLEDGAWRYSLLGAGAREVRPGDVDGWAWGAGTLTAGAAPPVIPFETVCRAELAAYRRGADPGAGAATSAAAQSTLAATPATPRRPGGAPTRRPVATPAVRSGADDPATGRGAGGPEQPSAAEAAATGRAAGPAGAAGGGPTDRGAAGAGSGAAAGAASTTGGGPVRSSTPITGIGAGEGGAQTAADVASEGAAVARAPAASAGRARDGGALGAPGPAGGRSPSPGGDAPADGPSSSPARRGVPLSGVVGFAAVGALLLAAAAWAWRRGMA